MQLLFIITVVHSALKAQLLINYETPAATQEDQRYDAVIPA